VTRALLLMGIVLCQGMPAEYFRNGNDMLDLCDARDGQAVALCLAYVIGVADAMAGGPVFGWRACIPAGVTTGQIRDTAVQFFYARIPLLAIFRRPSRLLRLWLRVSRVVNFKLRQYQLVSNLARYGMLGQCHQYHKTDDPI
jgi:hypothetical protein